MTRPPRRSVAARLLGCAAVLGIGAAATLSATAAPHRAATATVSPAGSVPHARAVPAGRLRNLRQVKHVFTIVLENEGFSHTFGDKAGSPYLASTLRRKGLLLPNYYATGHASLDNYISLVSGQAANSATQADCHSFTDFPADDQGKRTGGEPDQQLGAGCVYPSDIAEIGSQLSAKHLSWKGYMEDMGNISSRESASCGHPAVGAADGTQAATKGDGYATRHDPFVYFHEVIDHHRSCRRHVVALGSASGRTGLAHDLKHVSTTPDYSFITPNLCDDGHDYPCKTGQRSRGSAEKDIDHWLSTWVPRILHSAAYRKDGLLEITFDEADGGHADSAAACCGEGDNPNATGGMSGGSGPGGGRVGALLISPFLHGGTTSRHAYNHFSTLATDEAVFGLSKLGYAVDAQVIEPARFHHH